jgi:hypothetical protein
MFCQICGARIPDGRSACVQCGAPAGRTMGLSPAPASSSPNLSMEVRSCPRCGFQGASQAYFSTPGHLVLLLALTLASGGPLGIIYFIMRANHRLCPSCGEGWGKGGQLALQSGAGAAHGAAMAQIPSDVSGMSEGGFKRGFSWVLFVFAAILLVAGLGEWEAVPVMFSMMFGGGGFLLRRSANEDRMRRREAIIQSLQRPVLQLAAQRGGTLTVTEVASEFGWSIPRAEKVLQSLEDGYRVMGDVTPEGVIVYNFLELVRAPAPVSPRELAAPQDPALEEAARNALHRQQSAVHQDRPSGPYSQG